MVDVDGDGLQEVVVTGGYGSAAGIAVYKPIRGGFNGWLKVLPLSPHGAPGRGAMVTLYLSNGMSLYNVVGTRPGIDPVAHFGLGLNQALSLSIRWQGGRTVTKYLKSQQMNTMLVISYSGKMEEKMAATTENPILTMNYSPKYKGKFNNFHFGKHDKLTGISSDA